MSKLSYIDGRRGSGQEAPEYLAHFGLSRSPFTVRSPASADKSTIASGDEVGQISQALTQPGVTVVSGADNAFRKALADQALEKIDPQVPLARFELAPAKARRFLAETLEAFGFEAFNSSLPQYRNVLTAFLTHKSQSNAVAVIVIEQAEKLQQPLLEEVVRLMREQAPSAHVHILFLGQPRFEERVRGLFANLDCTYLDVASSEPINVADHVFGRLNAAGLPGRSLFTQPAIGYLSEIAKDDPMLIDHHCHRALEAAFRLGLKRVNKQLLQGLRLDSADQLETLMARSESKEAGEPGIRSPLQRRHSSLVMTRAGKRISRFELTKERLTLGRHKSNDIYIPRPGISLFHAIIVIEGKDVFLFDLRSTNGTCVNGQDVSRRRLTDGDVIFFGSLSLTFRQGCNGVLRHSENDVLPGFSETVVLEESDASEPTVYMQSTL